MPPESIKNVALGLVMVLYLVALMGLIPFAVVFYATFLGVAVWLFSDKVERDKNKEKEAEKRCGNS